MRKQLKMGLLMFTFFVFAQNVTVLSHEMDRYMLIPGGDAVGIHIETAGLIVVDTYTVKTDCGNFSPARDAGLIKGDVITAINGQPISDIEAYKEALIVREGLLVLTVNRAGNESEVVVTGCKNQEGELTTGVYLRNKIAGIGTLTYVDPASQKYGALGHEIIDQDTNRIVDIRQGHLIDSDISAIRKATDHEPGEKIAEIYFDQPHGTIEKNNEYGIYGEMTTEYFNTKRMLPIAYQNEVQLGKATIFTVIDGQNIEEFEIEIIEIDLQVEQEVKGIKYVVTDTRLIEETGGIIQGMSGSPIVQEGKIIGAVTHVLVHDSTIGYGVFIEWMLEESEIAYKTEQTTQAFRPAA
ncbi:MAG: SpoIVB peptidase [Defluviitaleaceae bacterium]|nr:SpoIVB peptidase [Defluviitaleaceae bacterium]